MSKRSKKYIEVLNLIDKKKTYTVAEACELVKKTSTCRFDASIELAVKLNLDTTKAEQQFRGNITLPHFFGKTTKILVLDDNLTADKAKEARIDYFGGNEQIQRIKEGWMDFDMIITTPKFMPELSKLGKILGPKGLMPNPKLGTVTPNTVAAATEFKKGKYSYRTDTYGNIHMMVGKISAEASQIAENINVFMDFLKSKRPSTVKGDYIQKVFICSSMGPSIKVGF